MPRKMEKEFESYDCEINYRWASQCTFCDFVNNEKIASKLSKSEVPILLYFCEKHSSYVRPDKICDEFLES